MEPKDVIRQTLDTSDFIIKAYVADLTDEDLRLVPVEGMHPLALQLGHLISAERMFKEMIEPGSAPPLPEGFTEAHDIKKTDGEDSRFTTKDEYVKLWDEQRAATKGSSIGSATRTWTTIAGARCPRGPRPSAPAQHGWTTRDQPFRPVRGRAPEAQKADRVLSVVLARCVLSSPLGRKLAPLRRMAAFGREEAIQQGRIHDATEPDLAVDRDDRHFGVVPCDQLGIAVDVDLLDREPPARLVLMEQVERLVAAAALCPRVDGKRQVRRRAAIASGGGSAVTSWGPSRSTFGQAEVVVVEFQSPTLFTPIEVERLDLLAEVGQLTQEEMPARRGPADTDRQLAESAEFDQATGTLRSFVGIHRNSPQVPSSRATRPRDATPAPRSRPISSYQILVVVNRVSD